MRCAVWLHQSTVLRQPLHSLWNTQQAADHISCQIEEVSRTSLRPFVAT
jgi:hypothetical protein